MRWGATLSHRFLQQLKLDVGSSLLQVLNLKFDILRLCLYWDESEPEPGKIELKDIIRLLERCEQQQQHVVLTVGMKAPRWPEFYFPNWVNPNPQDQRTQEQFLSFLQRVLPLLSRFQCIVAWQVENEPLDPSGPQQLTIPVSFLEQECSIMRQVDQRQLLLTTWGNQLRQRGFLPLLTKIAPCVGVDLYEHQYQHSILLGSRYIGPQDSLKKLGEYMADQSACVWITELQAEPWEKDDATYRANQPASMNAQILEQHINHALTLPVEVILFWGVEYWLWRAQRGDNSLLDVWSTLK